MRKEKARRPPRVTSIPPDLVPKVRARLERHAREKYADVCREVRIEAKGPYLYVDAVRTGPEGESEEVVKLCRLGFIWMGEYLWDFWFYSYAHERYERNLTMAGRYQGSPEECFDCAALAHLGADPSRISGTVYCRPTPDDLTLVG